MMVAMLSVGIASCGDDDDDVPGGGGTTTTNYGKDGLKGYWMEDDTRTSTSFFYLDGEGGGTSYYPSGDWDSKRFSTIYQESTSYHTIAYTKLFKTVKDNTGKIYKLYTFDSGKYYTVPIIYTRIGSTLIWDNGSKFNIADGSIVGYKRVTIVN